MCGCDEQQRANHHPAEIRAALGWKAGSEVVLTIEGNGVRLSRVDSVVSHTAGILAGGIPPGSPSFSAEELRALAERAIAEDVIERSSDHA